VLATHKYIAAQIDPTLEQPFFSDESRISEPEHACLAEFQQQHEPAVIGFVMKVRAHWVKDVDDTLGDSDDISRPMPVPASAVHIQQVAKLLKSGELGIQHPRLMHAGDDVWGTQAQSQWHGTDMCCITMSQQQRFQGIDTMLPQERTQDAAPRADIARIDEPVPILHT
jgi:hypothetical protein